MVAKELLKKTVEKARARPMLFEQSSRDHKAASNLASLKAWTKMIDLLKENGEDADKYLPDEAKEMIEEDKLMKKLTASK